MMMMGDDILDVMPPTFLELKIVESAGAGKTDTITNQGKSRCIGDRSYHRCSQHFIKEAILLRWIPVQTVTWNGQQE